MSACEATPILMPLPLQQCTRQPPGATHPSARTTAVRSRPHMASTCAISTVISTQADDWDSTMVTVIPAGVAGTDGFFLQ